MSEISRIFEEALIISPGHYYLFKPIVVGDYSFDASVIDHYKEEIVYNLGVTRIADVDGEDKYKIILLSNALFKLDKSQNYSMAYNYRKLDQEINSVLQFTDYDALVKDENTIYIIDKKSGDYLEVPISDHSNDISSSYTFSFVLNNMMVDVNVLLGVTDELYKHLSIVNKETKDFRLVEYSDDHSFIEMDIKRFGSRFEEISMRQSDNEFSVQINTRDLNNSKATEFCDGDIYRYLSVEGGKEPVLDMGEQSFDGDDCLENELIIADGLITTIEGEDVVGEDIETGMSDEEIDEEIDEQEVEEIDESEYSDTFLAVMSHPRNVELIEKVLDIGNENLNGIKEFVMKNYRSINDCFTAKRKTKLSDNIVNRIHNPVCDFGETELFNGFGKTK